MDLSELSRKSLLSKSIGFIGNTPAPFCVSVCVDTSVWMTVCVCVCDLRSEFMQGTFQTTFAIDLVEVNVRPPICCFLIIPLSVKKRRVEEYCRSMQQLSFSIYPFALLAISPSFVKSAVAAGGEFAQNALPGVSISCRKERRRRQRRRRISERGKDNE